MSKPRPAKELVEKAIGPLPSGDDDLPLRERIIEAVLSAGVVFWADPDANAFATVPMDQDAPHTCPVAHYRVSGRRFANIVRKLFGAANLVTTSRGDRPGAISDGPMTEALAAFGAMALSGETRSPAVRLAEQDGAIWIDLGDATHRAVKVTAGGWSIVARADAPLIRPDGLRALPVPVRSAEPLCCLESLLNLEKSNQAAGGNDGKGDFRLIVAWLVSCLFPTGPFPILALDGEQGSGKSTTARMLRRVVDPNAGDLRAMPRNEDDLLIAATNGRVVALDNVSYIEPEMADALCRVATGAGFGKRALYTDLGETIVSVSRPILLNGIPSLLARGDLADRAIAITLPAIPDDKRRPETEVWAAFDGAAPGILALLLDGLVVAMKNLPTLRIERLPRMADFARLACAAAPAFGWTQEQMLDAMAANRESAVTTVIDADPIADAVRAIAHDNAPWAGTASMLLDLINMRVPVEVKNERAWPRDAARLGTRLKRIAPALRRCGIEIETHRDGHDRTRTLVLTFSPNNRKTLSAPSALSAPPREPAADSKIRPADSNADSKNGVAVRTNALKTKHADSADSADSKIAYLGPLVAKAGAGADSSADSTPPAPSAVVWEAVI